MFEGPELLQDVTAIDKESDKEKKNCFTVLRHIFILGKVDLSFAMYNTHGFIPQLSWIFLF